MSTSTDVRDFPPMWDDNQIHALWGHGLEKTVNYIMRYNASEALFEALDGVHGNVADDDPVDSVLEGRLLSSMTSGVLFLKGVGHDHSLSVPANVLVIESLNGVIRQFVNVANSQGAPYTVAAGLGVDAGKFFCQDVVGRYINSLTATNRATVINSAIVAAPDFGTVLSVGDTTITSGIELNKPVDFVFDRLFIDSSMTVNGIAISGIHFWTQTGVTVKGRSITVNGNTWNASAIMLQNCIGVKIDVQTIHHATSTNKGVGIEWIAANGEAVMGCSIVNLRICDYFTIGIYLHTSGTGYINENEFINTWAGTGSTYCLKIHNEGGGIGRNSFDFRANAPNIATGFGVWLETGGSATYAFIDNNIFYNYHCWDSSGSAVVYHADSSVRHTCFVGSMFDLSKFEDSGKDTVFVGATSSSNRLVIESVLPYYNLAVPTNAGWTAAVAGSGATTQGPTHLKTTTGASASSSAVLSADVYGVDLGAYSYSAIVFAPFSELAFSIARLDNVSAVDEVVRVQLKTVNTEGDLAASGIGVYVAGDQLYGETYGSERGTVLLGTVSANIMYNIRIRTANAAVYFYVNGVLAGSITAAAEISASVTTAKLVFSANNGGNAQWVTLIVSKINLYVTRTTQGLGGW